MLFCNNCGQCMHLSDDHFIQNLTTSGWETGYVDAADGDWIEMIDSEISDSSHDNYECPHCSSEDISDGWNGSEETALLLREDYNTRMRMGREESERIRKEKELFEKAKDPERQWDIMGNV